MSEAPGPPPSAPHRPQPFRLTRYFSLASLVGVLAVTACLLWTYRALTEHQLVEHEGRANAEMTHAFANSVWADYRGFVLGSLGRTRQSLLADPAVARLHAEVLAKMRGLKVAKIKIYNLAGLTVFSTDDKQIGEDKSTNQGLIDARAGKVASNITFREKFDAFEGTLSKRNLISSYVPVRSAHGGPVEGVFEIYSDVTELMQAQSQAQSQVALVVLALLAGLYLFLLVVVRKAALVIDQQERERAAREELLHHQALHDTLTGLPNRACFTQRLEQTLAQAQRLGHACALMFMDLDHFKTVNDSLGHQAGDELLQLVAQRLRGCLREGDLLFRVGGDEFTVILPHVSAPEDADGVARRILHAMAPPSSGCEQERFVSATIGIAVHPGDGETARELLKNADAAMYSAKEQGRGTHAFYRAAMNQRALQRLTLEVALQQAIVNHEFELHYQPRVNTPTRQIVGLEVLLRWNSPSRGLVAPSEFIGVLEDSGMMGVVGEWVLRSACQQVRQWADEGREPLRVSINVSTVQFQDSHFVSHVHTVLRETGARPDLIELELTESMLMANAEQARRNIGELKALGLRISIDDFGTGYSSLNYLRHFAVDYLKIDRSFVTHVAYNQRDQAVATAIIELAKALDIKVVAEGVETEAQAAFFARVHCHELQGYLFSRPLPVQQLMPLLQAQPQPSRARELQSI